MTNNGELEQKINSVRLSTMAARAHGDRYAKGYTDALNKVAEIVRSQDK